jgi:hypothetical protein
MNKGQKDLLEYILVVVLVSIIVLVILALIAPYIDEATSRFILFIHNLLN